MLRTTDFGCRGCGGNLVNGRCPECNPTLVDRATVQPDAVTDSDEADSASGIKP